GHELVGFAIMQFGDASAHLNLLAVRPHVRRRGLGRQMLDWLHESAIVAGTFTINLELRAGNVDARRFYLSMGYTESGHVHRYYSALEDAVRMTRNLTVQEIP
ncbi:MAG TPA: GNAT family N-acetyltransferase, partial [Steroidobacteraceae bacterium]|nr:GNAT family N-acetyltransferase [Steroidobacteraceae bacterium]